MEFSPTADKLIPDLSPREELVVLARALWREGYNDHLAGHITVALGDGTLLCNPWLITWEELHPSQVLRIDLDRGGIVRNVTVIVASDDADFDAQLVARLAHDAYAPAKLGGRSIGSSVLREVRH